MGDDSRVNCACRTCEREMSGVGCWKGLSWFVVSSFCTIGRHACFAQHCDAGSHYIEFRRGAEDERTGGYCRKGEFRGSRDENQKRSAQGP